MQKFIFFFIFLPSFQCFQSEECFKAKKTAVLIFYYYPGPAKDNARVEITSYILPQSQVDTAYYLSGNETSRNTLRVLNVRCVQTKNNRIPCLQKSQSSYIAIEHITEDGCVMKLEGTSHQIKTFIHSIYLKKFPHGFNLTCIIGRIYDASNLINENPLAKTSLISIIFLSSCAIITCGLCIGWLGFSYCRQFKQRRLKRRQQKVLENAVRKFLEKSPVILFNSKIKSQDFTDDDPMCAVCLESFNDNEKLRKLMCSHYFHIACIDPWLLAHQNCPLCNQNILNEPIQTISGRITLTNDESTNTPVVVVS